MSSSSTYTLRGLRITRCEPAGASGWWVNFAAVERDTFFAAVGRVRALPEQERAWHPEERAWWVSVWALGELARQLPDLAEALTAWRGRAHSSAGSTRGAGSTSSGERRRVGC